MEKQPYVLSWWYYDGMKRLIRCNGNILLRVVVLSFALPKSSSISSAFKYHERHEQVAS
jgi:hypothetical protein